MDQAPADTELRNIIDKLAQFVARNGPEFEQMTKNKQKDNPKFGFLFGGEYFNYYQYKVTTEQAILKQKGLNALQNADPRLSLSQRQQQQQPQPMHNNVQNNGLNSIPVQNNSMGQTQGPVPGSKAWLQNELSNFQNQQTQLQDQIQQSEQNLAAQHTSLMSQQQNKIEDAVRQSQEKMLLMSAQNAGLDLANFNMVLQPIIDTCTKDGISAGKAWILQHSTSPDAIDVIAEYLLKKLIQESTFNHKLHIIYLVNDVLHHCARKKSVDLRKAMEKVVVPMFCNASLAATDEQLNKLNKLLSLWESKNNYFDEGVIDKLKDPAASWSDYQSDLMTQHAEPITAITNVTKQTLDNYQTQHQAFVNHALRQIQTLEQQKLSIEQQLKALANAPPPGPPVSLPHSNHDGPPPGPHHEVHHHQPGGYPQSHHHGGPPPHDRPPPSEPSHPHQYSGPPERCPPHQGGPNGPPHGGGPPMHHGPSPGGPPNRSGPFMSSPPRGGMPPHGDYPPHQQDYRHQEFNAPRTDFMQQPQQHQPDFRQQNDYPPRPSSRSDYRGGPGPDYPHTDFRPDYNRRNFDDEYRGPDNYNQYRDHPPEDFIRRGDRNAAPPSPPPPHRAGGPPPHFGSGPPPHVMPPHSMAPFGGGGGPPPSRGPPQSGPFGPPPPLAGVGGGGGPPSLLSTELKFSQPPPGWANPPNDHLVPPQAPPPPLGALPDLSKPPPNFSAPPPFVHEPSAEDLLPSMPYFDLPAGLMVPLIKLEDGGYKALDPDRIRLPPPAPPSERLIAAVEAFYAPPNHDSPRDSDGWEKLGLYEYYKAKNIARKRKEEDVTNGMREKSRSRSPIDRPNSKSPSPPKKRYRSRSKSKSRSRSKSRGRSKSKTPPITNHRRSSTRSNSGSHSSRKRRRNSGKDRSPDSRRLEKSERSPTPPSFFGGMYNKSIPDSSLDESNRGHQLLKKMGWGGAGLGASEQGIENPISGGEIRDKVDQYKGVGISVNDPYENFRKSKGQAFITRMKARAEERTDEKD